MMPRTGEMYARAKSDFEVQRGMPPEDTLAARVEFVKAMKWFPESFTDDTDRYDLSGDAYHFTRRDESGLVIAAMRLTPIENIEISLSYEMMGANLGLQAAALRSQESLKDSDLWDLTRLVYPPDGSQDRKEIEDAMIELFGMAAYVSAGELDYPNPRTNWVFTTTPMILRFLQEAGIQYSVLATGKLPDIEGKGRATYFCQVNVAAALEALPEQHLQTLTLLKKGAAKVEEESLYA